MSKVPVKFNLPELGEVEVLLTEDQAKKAIADGKKLYQEKAEEGTDTSNYIYSGQPTTTTSSSNHFSSSDVDWNSFFPDISLEEIQELSANAVKHEEAIRKKAVAVCSLIKVALGSYMGGEDKVDFKNIDFFKPKE